MEARLIAVQGFLRLLTVDSAAVAAPSGAAGSSAAGAGRTAITHVVSPYEVLGNLRRCLSQQPEVRLHLYEGLADVVRAQPTVLPAVLEVLVPHVRWPDGVARPTARMPS